MKSNQLTRGNKFRLMYVECKSGAIDGATARIGWVTFSKSGRSVYYRGRSLGCSNGPGIAGNYFDRETGDEYWVSGVKLRGSNTHPGERGIDVIVDDDAQAAFAQLRNSTRGA